MDQQAVNRLSTKSNWQTLQTELLNYRLSQIPDQPLGIVCQQSFEPALHFPRRHRPLASPSDRPDPLDSRA